MSKINLNADKIHTTVDKLINVTNDSKLNIDELICVLALFNKSMDVLFVLTCKDLK